MISQPGSVAASAVDFEIACERTGLDLVTMLVSGDYAGATKSFDTAMKAALPSDRLAEIWAAIVGANGMVVGLDKPVVRRSSHDAQFTIVVPVRFSGAILDATVACDSSGLVAGLHFNAHHASPEPGPVREPDFEESVRIDSQGVELEGSFFRPQTSSATFPAVLIIGGSGPTDRYGSIGPNKPLRDIAIGLAERGIAALAFDKRTHTYPERPVSTVQEELVDDSVQALRFLSEQPRVNPSRLFILGHSFGGTMAPLVAKKSGIASGLILLAPTFESLDQAYFRQASYLASIDGNIDRVEEAKLTEISRQLAELKSVKLGMSSDESLPLGIPVSYWKSLWSYDPIAIARNVNLPILALFAGRDYQVLADASLAKLKNGLADGPELEAHIYPALGHTMMPMDDPPGPAKLLAPGQVSMKAVDDIAGWIVRQERVEATMGGE